MKVVLDTNVFISGVFFSGPPFEIIKAFLDKRIQVIISFEVLREYKRAGEQLMHRYPEIKISPILESFLYLFLQDLISIHLILHTQTG